MTDPKAPKTPRGSDPTAVGDKGSDKRSGRVAYDSRGNPTWEWQLETGVYTRDVSTHRLRKLDLGDLSIAETAKHPTIDPEKAAEEQRRAATGGGFNPYDNSSSTPGGFNPYDNARALGGKLRPAAGPSTAPTPASPKKPVDLKRLEEWMQAKKRAEENRDEDDE